MISALKSTLKNTLIYSIGTFSSRLAGFILIPLYTSHFSVEEYGMMGIMEITSQMLLALLGFSLYNAFFRWYWDNKYVQKQKSIFFTILVFLFCQILLFLIMVITFRHELSLFLFDSESYTYLIQLLLIVSGLEAVGVLISALLRLKERAILYTVLQLVKLMVSLLLTIYLIVYRNSGIEAVYEAQLIANILYFIMIFNVLRKSVTVKLEWKILRDMLSFSLPLVLTSISGIILNITDRYSLRFLTDMSTVGVYSLGFKVSNTIRAFIITSVNLALQPMIYKMMDSPGNKRFYSKVLTYFTFGLMFFILFFSLYAPEIVKLISKQNMAYWDAYKIIPILSFSMLVGMMRDVSLTGLNITKRTRTIAVLIISSAVLNILLNRFLIPAWGFYGAAIATTLSQTFFFIIVYFFAQKHYPIPYEIHKVILMISVGIGIYLTGHLTNSWPLEMRLIIKGLLIVSFPFILYLLGFYELIELERMRQYIKKWYNPFGWLKNLRK